MSEKNVKDLFGLTSPSRQQKDKMLFHIVESRREARPAKRMRLKIIMAAAVISLMTSTAWAAAYYGLDERFLSFLKPANHEQTEYLSNGAYTVDQQAITEQGTLDVRQVIGDSNLTYILMDFTAPEGTVLDAARYRFNPGWIDADTHTGNLSYGVGFTVLEDADPQDNKISLIMSLIGDKSYAGANVKLSLRNLEAAGPFPGIFETVIEGEWGTSFKLGFKDFSKTYESNRKMSLYGYETILTSVSISPISITLKLESPYTKEISQAAPLQEVGKNTNTYRDTFPITIHYKDGTSETTTYFTGTTTSDYLTDTITSVKTFEGAINDKEIKSIEFFDITVPIPQDG